MKKTQEEAKRLELKSEQLLRKFETQLGARDFLVKSKKHLDFGCGYGFFAKTLGKRYPKMSVIPIDFDRESISNARKYRKLGNIIYKCTGKISGKYDSISVTYVLHDVKNLKTVLKQLWKSLNSGGKIIISDFKSLGGMVIKNGL